MRGLASGAEGFEAFPKHLKKNFVLVNYYCTSVAEEHDPRGPEGPYQFQDRSVPLFVIKDWEGKTLVQQLGFPSSGGTKAVSRWIEKAMKANGPVVPPKNLKPLIKAMKAAEKHLGKKRPGNAWKELVKVVKGGADMRKFPEGPPTIAVEAQAKIDAILEEATAAIEAALEEEDPAACLKALRALRSPYGAIPAVKERLAKEIAARK